MKPGVYETLERIARMIEERKGSDPESSYVARLFAKGEDAILKKIGEEATETVIAAKSGDRLQTVRETADLWFHCLVMLSHKGLGPEDVLLRGQPGGVARPGDLLDPRERSDLLVDDREVLAGLEEEGVGALHGG